MTVLADHGAPLGVSTWRAFNSAATARADMPVNSERIGATDEMDVAGKPVQLRDDKLCGKQGQGNDSNSTERLGSPADVAVDNRRRPGVRLLKLAEGIPLS
jgi:hypothetical protein